MLSLICLLLIACLVLAPATAHRRNSKLDDYSSSSSSLSPSSTRKRPTPSPTVPPDVPSGDCDACDSADCVVSESIKVNSLCANELCVDGDPLVGGDGDPCTHDELSADSADVVHVRIKECCRADSNDCEDFSPSACHVSTCILEEGGTHGYCVHEPIHGCCACDADCPVRPCHEATCAVKEDPDQPLLVYKGDGQLAPLTKRSKPKQTEQKECQYTSIDECCVRSSGPPKGGEDDGLSCDGVCPDGQTAVCDKGCECQCIPATEFECLRDCDCRDDCEDDEAPVDNDGGDTLAELWGRSGGDPDNSPPTRRRRKKKKRRPQGPCIAPVCTEQRICAFAFDPTFDADGDGVPCKIDCDDTDASKGEYTYCALADYTFNADGDEFSKCGAPVTRFCLEQEGDELPECPSDDGGDPPKGPFNRVEKEEVVQSVQNPKLLVLRYNCDCCDNNELGLDEPACCALDVDGDGYWLCGSEEEACIEQRTNITAPPPPKEDWEWRDKDWDWRDKQWRDKPRDKDWRPRKPPRDQEADREEQDDACKRWANLNDLELPRKYIVVDAEDKGNPELCEDCEDNSDEREAGDKTCYLDNDGDTAVHCPRDSTVQTCCSTIIDAYTTDLSDLQKQVLACCTFKVQADDFADDNCPAETKEPILLKECECPVDYTDDIIDVPDHCDDDPNGHFWHTCYPDLDQDCVADCEKPLKICSKIEDAALACHKIGHMFIEEVGNPDTNPQCDCDDRDEWVYQLVACLPDADYDTYPSCDCELKCSKDDECPRGYVPALPAIVGQPVKRSLDAVERLLAKRHPSSGPWSGGKGKDRKWRKCTPPDFEHQKCPEIVVRDDCDCCDSDKFVFPNSPHSSTSQTKCGGYDYNCNTQIDPILACEINPLQTDDGRYIFDTNDLLVFEFPDPEQFGTCTPQDAVCELTPGWAPLATIARKRVSVTREAPSGCTDDNIVDAVSDGSGGLVTPIERGQCAEAFRGCVRDEDTCHEDCTICILAEQ